MISFIKRNKKEKPHQSISLALSGGGARGAIHVGVIQALVENNIKIDAIAGTSIGSIVGAFFCGGVPPEKMLEILKTQSFSKLFHFSWNKKGLLKMERLYKIMEDYLPANSFEELKIPFYACVSNIDKGRHEIISTGNLHTAVAASASIPVIFEPVEINGDNYVDGGLFCNLPVKPLTENNNSYILGVHVNNLKPPEELNFIAVAERVFTLVIFENARKYFEKCNYLINPFLEDDYGLLDFGNIEKLYTIGYNEGVKFIENLRKDNVLV